MEQSPKKFLALPYTREFVRDENGAYSASIVEMPGCFAIGDDIAEANANLDDAAESWILSELDQGRSIPDPLGEGAFSGKLVVRLPKSLHRQAARLALRESASLNTFIVMALSAWIGSKSLVEQITGSVRLLTLGERTLIAALAMPEQTQSTDPIRLFTNNQALLVPVRTAENR